MKDEELIKKIIDDTVRFRKLVLTNWKKVDNKTLSLVTKEYLAFLMHCAIFMLQNNDLSNIELDDFTKAFYEKVVKMKLLEADELLDYEKLSRERYMDFYQILSEGTENNQLEGERLNALVAKETLHMQKMLSECGEKEDALIVLYPELSSVYSGLMLATQLMFSLDTQKER